jgi:hypothetical protein
MGMDPKTLAGVLNTSTGRCWASEINNPCPGALENVPASRGYTGGFAAGGRNHALPQITDCVPQRSFQYNSILSLSDCVWCGAGGNGLMNVCVMQC